MKLVINELFYTVQGEGKFTGRPSIFLRTTTCNLRCVFANGSMCDTAYTSHRPEKGKFQTVDELMPALMDLFTQHPHADLVITGGEPLLWQTALVEVIKQLKERFDPLITVETNGTIVPNDGMRDMVDLWSVSPKLSTSGCFEGSRVAKKLQEQHHKIRINQEALSVFNNNPGEGSPVAYGDIQFKFVVSNEESLQEIQEIQKMIGIANHNIYLMPEGQTEEQIRNSSAIVMPMVLENGYNFCDRLHIRIWGSRRGV